MNTSVLNAYLPIEVTEAGRVMEVMAVPAKV
jgi:hypothetical protein